MTNTKEWIDWLKEIADVNGFKSFAEAAKHVEQLQAELEAIMQQRDSYRHQATALNLLNEQLEERCAELERERAEVARKAITKAKKTFKLRTNGNEDFQAGIDYCVDAYDRHLDQYAQREYGVDHKQ
jgi:regulator of replication initiation timing